MGVVHLIGKIDILSWRVANVLTNIVHTAPYGFGVTEEREPLLFARTSARSAFAIAINLRLGAWGCGTAAHHDWT